MNLYSQTSNSSNDHLLFNPSHEIETETGAYTSDGWTFEENKIFETAMVDFEDTSSMPFFRYVASLMPWQTLESIQKHEQILNEDVDLIKSSDGNFEDLVEEYSEMEEVTTRVMTPSPRPRKKPEQWSHEEHRLFLRGLEEMGKGQWKAISKKYLPTRTPAQIASHAQKFEKRPASKTPPEKRRTSINDIRSYNDPCFFVNSQDSPPNQHNLLLNSQTPQPNPFASENLQPNPFIPPFNFQENFPSNHINFSLDFQNPQPNQLNFPLGSHDLETSGLGNATNFSHVHNNY